MCLNYEKEREIIVDFTKIPVFDNHAHSINEGITHLTKAQFLGGYTGYKDDTSVPNGDIRDPLYGAASPELLQHNENTSVVQSTVTHLAKYFGCEPTLDAVLEERNRRAANGMYEYSKALYDDAGLIAGVLETTNPIGEDIEDKMPGHQVCRLFQFDEPFFRLIRITKNFEELYAAWEKEAIEALTSDHYDGIKCHLSEVYNHQDLRTVTPEEANFYFKKAQAEDKGALKIVYMALLTKVMVFSQKYDAPIHLHVSAGGSTCFGEPGIEGALTCKDGSMYDADPFLLMDFLKTSEFRKTKIVCLHGGFPWVREVATLASDFPHVYIDVSLTLTFCGLGADQFMEELLSKAPHTKILIGSGQVAFPEKAWLAAKVAKETLARVLQKAVDNGYMTEAMAQQTAENILYKNAARVHRLYKPE